MGWYRGCGVLATQTGKGQTLGVEAHRCPHWRAPAMNRLYNTQYKTLQVKLQLLGRVFYTNVTPPLAGNVRDIN